MTDQEIFQRFVDKFGNRYPAFNESYWEELGTGLNWYKNRIPTGTYAEVMERYHRALIEIVSIEEVMRRGGFDDVCAKV